MNSYTLSILNASGGAEALEVLAEDRTALSSRCEQEGWVVLSVTARRRSKIHLKSDDLILLCQHLQLMLEAGLPIRDALLALAEESDTPTLSLLCQLSVKRIDGGEQLSQALEGVDVDAFFLAMIRTGEKTGRLPELLARAAHHLQWRDDIRRKMWASLSYPLLIIAVLFVVVPLLFIYLVPQLMGFLSFQDTALPWYTRALIGVADFCQQYGLTVLFVCGSLLVLLALAWALVAPFRLLCERYALAIPLLGSLQLQLKTAQLAEQLGIMYSAGIPVTESITLISESLGNSFLCTNLRQVSERLSQGLSLHEAFSGSVFPSMFKRLIKVGELSGSLDKTMTQAAILYSRQAHRRADKLSAVVGPVVLLFAGLLIIWLVSALILPLYDGLFSMGTGL